MLKNSNLESDQNSVKGASLFGPQTSNVIANELKAAAGVAAGAWALKRFPKLSAIALIGVGVIVGLTLKEVARSVDRFPRSGDDLH